MVVINCFLSAILLIGMAFFAIESSKIISEQKEAENERRKNERDI